jgi:hypothetical protein
MHHQVLPAAVAVLVLVANITPPPRILGDTTTVLPCRRSENEADAEALKNAGEMSFLASIRV